MKELIKMVIALLRILLHKVQKLLYIVNNLHITWKSKIRNFIVVCLLFITIVVGLLGSLSNQVSGQSQLPLPLSAEESAALKEAEQWNKKVIDLYKKGKFSEAIPLAKQSLEITEKVLGKEHLYVAATLNNLAALYVEQGNYQQAEPLYQRSLTIKENILDKEHPDVATALNNLGGLYQAQGSYQQAIPLFQRALAIREKALGDSDILVAVSLNNLGSLYTEQGNYQQAEPIYQRALF
jgi:tetratricopeptide (TPR) repeat protein